VLSLPLHDWQMATTWFTFPLHSDALASQQVSVLLNCACPLHLSSYAVQYSTVQHALYCLLGGTV